MRATLIVALLFFIKDQPRVALRGPSVAEQYLFSQANAERAQRGLSELRWDDALYRAAVAHAEEMAQRESISHQYPGEPELAARGKSAGAKFSVISENVAEAPTAVWIHGAWMNSPGHRENLLDPRVTAVGISVLRRDEQLYAVEDFAKLVETLPLDVQEQRVAELVQDAARVQVTATDDARRTCSMESGYAGRQPRFVMRYTASDLGSLPNQLLLRLQSGAYREATVGACKTKVRQSFTSYSIAVMLYP